MTGGFNLDDILNQANQFEQRDHSDYEDYYMTLKGYNVGDPKKDVQIRMAIIFELLSKRVSLRQIKLKDPEAINKIMDEFIHMNTLEQYTTNKFSYNAFKNIAEAEKYYEIFKNRGFDGLIEELGGEKIDLIESR